MATLAFHLKRLFSAPVTDDLTNWQTVVKAIEKRNGFEYTDKEFNGIRVIELPTLYSEGIEEYEDKIFIIPIL